MLDKQVLIIKTKTCHLNLTSTRATIIFGVARLRCSRRPPNRPSQTPLSQIPPRPPSKTADVAFPPTREPDQPSISLPISYNISVTAPKRQLPTPPPPSIGFRIPTFRESRHWHVDIAIPRSHPPSTWTTTGARRFTHCIAFVYTWVLAWLKFRQPTHVEDLGRQLGPHPVCVPGFHGRGIVDGLGVIIVGREFRLRVLRCRGDGDVVASDYVPAASWDLDWSLAQRAL